MATTNYYTVDGMILGESTSGVHTSYGPDALGSVIATYAAGAPQNSYLWAPYGTRIQKTGSASDPSFGWNGSSGYRNTGRNYAGLYVRRRPYDYSTGQWVSADPTWPSQRAYTYSLLSPATISDPSGLWCLIGGWTLSQLKCSGYLENGTPWSGTFPHPNHNFSNGCIGSNVGATILAVTATIQAYLTRGDYLTNDLYKENSIQISCNANPQYPLATAACGILNNITSFDFSISYIGGVGLGGEDIARGALNDISSYYQDAASRIFTHAPLNVLLLHCFGTVDVSFEALSVLEIAQPTFSQNPNLNTASGVIGTCTAYDDNGGCIKSGGGGLRLD